MGKKVKCALLLWLLVYLVIFLNRVHKIIYLRGISVALYWRSEVWLIIPEGLYYISLWEAALISRYSQYGSEHSRVLPDIFCKRDMNFLPKTHFWWINPPWATFSSVWKEQLVLQTVVLQWIPQRRKDLLPNQEKYPACSLTHGLTCCDDSHWRIQTPVCQ